MKKYSPKGRKTFSKQKMDSQVLSGALKGSQGLSIIKARAYETLKEVKRKIFTKENKNFQKTEQKFSAKRHIAAKWNFFQQKEHKFSAKGTKIVSN